MEQTLAAAENGATAMAKLSGYERNQILQRGADLVAANLEDLARTISLEEGKPISESRGEVGRMPDLLRLCGFEGSQLRGESLPLDAQSGAKGKLGFTLRVPCGVVVAITPFNYPVLLVIARTRLKLPARRVARRRSGKSRRGHRDWRFRQCRPGLHPANANGSPDFSRK
jgi:glyceraldehyde-3-phosphate dehydrogenase (NADP+)